MPRLVLADANLTTQRMVELSLETEGYEVLPFTDGKEALEYILHHEVDVVLANVSFPGLDGYSLCAQLAEEPDKAGVPVVLLVGALDGRPVALDFSASRSQPADSWRWLRRPGKPFQRNRLQSRICSKSRSRALTKKRFSGSLCARPEVRTEPCRMRNCVLRSAIWQLSRQSKR